MLSIPELRTVIVQPPRTASTSLAAAVLERYPEALHLYRHQTSRHIPDRYKDYDVMCMIRDPLHRMHSMWRYMKVGGKTTSDMDWKYRVMADADRPFEEWLLNSKDQFHGNSMWHGVDIDKPAARSSCFLWGVPEATLHDTLFKKPTTWMKVEDVAAIEERLDLKLPVLNAAPEAPLPEMTSNIWDFLWEHHAFEMAAYYNMNGTRNRDHVDLS